MSVTERIDRGMVERLFDLRRTAAKLLRRMGASLCGHSFVISCSAPALVLVRPRIPVVSGPRLLEMAGLERVLALLAAPNAKLCRGA